MATFNVWIFVAVALTATASLAIHRAKNTRTAWRYAVATTGFVLLLLGLGYFKGTVDVVVIAYTFVAFVIALALPRLQAYGGEVSSLLALQAAGLGLLGFSDPRLAFLAFLVPPILSWRRSKVFLYYEVVGAAAFLLGIAFADFGIPMVAGLCFVVAASIRQGVFPFHSGTLALGWERAQGTVEVALIAPTGLAVFLRHALPLLQQGSHRNAALVTILMVSGIYLSLLCLVQEKVSRIAGLAPAVIASLIFAMAAAGAPHLSAAWVLLILCGAGLALTARLAEARAIDGAVRSLAGFYLVFAFALAGLPGTLGFVAEEALEESLLGISGAHLFASLAAIALMTIGLYRAYTKLFLGAPLPTEVAELSWRERIGLAALAITLVGFGILR